MDLANLCRPSRSYDDTRTVDGRPTANSSVTRSTDRPRSTHCLPASFRRVRVGASAPASMVEKQAHRLSRELCGPLAGGGLVRVPPKEIQHHARPAITPPTLA